MVWVPIFMVVHSTQVYILLKPLFSRHKGIGVQFTDEPTGALDSKATEDLLTLFNKINERGQTILMVTHSTKAASHARRVLFIKDGEVFHQIYRGNLTSEELYAKISDTLTMLTTGGEKHE